MREDAYRTYELESGNWLHRGRARLLECLLAEVRAGTKTNLSILEVGAGIGQNVRVLSEFGSVDVGEIDPLGLHHLEKEDSIGHIYRDPIPFDVRKAYDVVCALDVIEHLEDDAGAVSWIADILSPDGYFVISVPAYQWLFSEHDLALGHHRRYTKTRVDRLLSRRFRVVRSGYFNSTVLPVAIAKRMLQRITRPSGGDADGDLQKDSSTVPRPIDRSLGRILDAEAALFRRRPIVPFGLTIFALGQVRQRG